MFSRGRTNLAKGQMADATWRAGFARLAPLNLTFEAWLYHPQLMELADLARAFPQTTIILNHVGGPLGIGPYADKKEETFAAWKAGIAELGKCQNVVVKLGGLGMLLGMFDFHTRETPPSSEELARAMHRGVRPRSRHLREQLPAGRRQFELRRPVECLQTPGRRLLGRREGQAVQRYGRSQIGASVRPVASAIG